MFDCKQTTWLCKLLRRLANHYNHIAIFKTCHHSSPFQADHQSLHSPQPAEVVSASPSVSWHPSLAAPAAASCRPSGSAWSLSAAGSLPEPANKRAVT